jgi:hypothetical protein
MTGPAVGDQQGGRSLRGAWLSVSYQWGRSRIARFGVVLAGVILCAEALFRVGAWSATLGDEARELDAANRTAQSLAGDSGWRARTEQAARQSAALEAMLWEASDDALLQASLQDALRAMATRAGLPIRELTVSRQLVGQAQPSQAGRGALPDAGADLGSPRGSWNTAALESMGVGHWSVRMTLEFKRIPVMMFLNELTAYEKALVIERFEIKLMQAPPTLELELRVLSRATRGSSSRMGGS